MEKDVFDYHDEQEENVAGNIVYQVGTGVVDGRIRACILHIHSAYGRGVRGHNHLLLHALAQEGRRVPEVPDDG